jgi:hypothetical protein
MILVSMLATLWLPGCAPVADPVDDDTIEIGTLSVSFDMSADYMKVMEEPPVGVFRGEVYHSEEVDGMGPLEGASALYAFEVDVDLTPNGGPTEPLHVTDELPAGWVTILGFLDSDRSGPSPDSKDPVTIPGENEFTVEGGAETDAVVHFGFLYP